MPSVPHATSQLKKKKGNELKVKAEYDLGNIYESADDQMTRAREDDNRGQELTVLCRPLQVSSICGFNYVHGKRLS